MNLIWELRIWKGTCGQDLVYALMAGFVAFTAGSAGIQASVITQNRPYVIT